MTKYIEGSEDIQEARNLLLRKTYLHPTGKDQGGHEYQAYGAQGPPGRDPRL